MTGSVRDWIVYEQNHIIVLNKPAGLPSTGHNLDDPHCAQHRLIQKYGRMVWAVHQLDAETSGLNIFVARKSLVPRMAERLKSSGQKRYLAICHGVPKWTKKRIDAPIGWIEDERRRGITPHGKRAISTITVLASNPTTQSCLINATIHTGRTHQIRIHMADQGHALFGDKRYNQPPCTQHPRHALHASEILFKDDPLQLSAPLPDDFKQLAKRLKLQIP